MKLIQKFVNFFRENLWVAINKWKFFSGKDNYFLPFQMPYSFLATVNTPWDMFFYLNKVNFINFGPGGNELSSSLPACEQQPSALKICQGERFLCWPTYIIWKGHVSLTWKLGAKRSWWQILSCKLAFNKFVIFLAMVDWYCCK